MNLKEEEIYAKIEEIYKSEKGKGFITHLIRSFLPLDRSTFMFSNDKNKKMVCAITGKSLISKDEIVKFQLENMDAILKNMSDRFLGKTNESVIVENLKGKLLAVECEKSDKLLCLEAVKQLFNFSASELLKGNKHVNYVFSDERNKVFSKQNNLNKREEKAVKRATTNRATMRLSDIDVLSDLKKKLENKEKNNDNKGN